jgi:hypothetical protein
MNQRLQHDVAWNVSLHILDVFSNLLREEEKRDAFDAVYERVKAGLVFYDHEAKSLLHRLRPLQN